MWRMGGERREDGGVTVTCLFETYFVSELDIFFNMFGRMAGRGKGGAGAGLVNQQF